VISDFSVNEMMGFIKMLCIKPTMTLLGIYTAIEIKTSFNTIIMTEHR